MSDIKSSRFIHIDWQSVFRLWSIQGFVAFLWLLLLPTNTRSEVALGFSAARLALLALAAFMLTGSIALLVQSRRPLVQQTWLNLDRRPTLWDLIYLISIAASLLAPLSVLVLYDLPGDANSSHAARLSPLAIWVTLSGLELAIFLAVRRQGNVVDTLKGIKPQLRLMVIFLPAILLLAGIILATKIGITPDRNWGAPAVPLLEWQIFLALLLVGIFAFFPRISSSLGEAQIAVGIYVFTLALWLNQPTNTAFFATPPRAPNFEIYPFSDPLVYAQSAQSALAGNGFLWPEVPARSFYVAFLTWAHLFGNQNYENVITIQTLVLALLPVALYFVGRALGGRPLGLSLAILTAFRDVNSNIAAPFSSSVTNSKLLLSELPAALLICLVTLLTMRWLRQPNQRAWIPFLTGGLLGTATLIRTQSITLFAVILLFSFLLISDRRQWLIGSTCLMLGIAITLAPWLIRNYMATGGFILDNPLTQTMTMTRRWSGSMGNEGIPRLPGENDAQFSSRMLKLALEYFKQNPRFILQTTANHFVNNETASLLAFPIRDVILSPAELVFPQHEFWKTTIKPTQLPLFLFYLFIFSLGVATAWYHHRLIGLLPLVFGLIYNLWTALFFASGGRFIVPLDWSVSLYQLFGLLILGGMLLSFTRGARENASEWILNPFDARPADPESDALSRRRFFLILMLILFLGLFLPLTESVFPQKYPPLSQDEIAGEIGLIPKEGEVALYGRAIYPRYFDAGEGEPETAKIGYEPNEKARLVFFLIGPQNGLVVCELKEPPDFFPHVSDVFMIGTQTTDYFSPRIVKVIKDSQSELYVGE